MGNVENAPVEQPRSCIKKSCDMFLELLRVYPNSKTLQIISSVLFALEKIHASILIDFNVMQQCWWIGGILMRFCWLLMSLVGFGLGFLFLILFLISVSVFN